MTRHSEQTEIPVDGIGPYVTVERAAKLLGLTYSTLDSRIRRNAWPVVLIHGVRLLRRDDLPRLRDLGR